MSFFIENTGGDFERVPVGMHLSRCYRLIDLGTQETTYMGAVKKQPKLMLGWEIHGMNEDGTPIKMSDGRPFAIFKNYTNSLDPRGNLFKDIQSWRGRPFTPEEAVKFDLDTVLGHFCMVSIVESTKEGKTYTNVDSVTPVPIQIKKLGLPEAVNPTQSFYLGNPDMKMFETFSNNLKTKIQKSPEWARFTAKTAAPAKAATPASTFSDMDDDIPF